MKKAHADAMQLITKLSNLVQAQAIAVAPNSNG